MQNATPIYDENELVSRIAKGDELAFTAFFYQYSSKIYTVALKLTRSRLLAEEIVQDTFLKIWIRRDALAEVRNLESYLFITARNHTLDVMEKLARQQVVSGDLDEDTVAHGFNSDSYTIQKDYAVILAEAVNKLPPQQKKVYILSKDEGLRRDEIAAAMGISPETVKIHLGHAMRSVRAYCKAHMELYTIALILGIIP